MRSGRPLLQPFLIFLILLSGSVSAAIGSTTTLTISSGGNNVSTVAAGNAVTLTAAVNGGTVTQGLVNFCNAVATYCTDIQLVGSAQLTSAGTATLTLLPGMGVHSYRAVFAGTNAVGGSASSAASLTVTGSYPTATSLTALGEQGNYSLTATVVAKGSMVSGAVSFLDTSNGNASLASSAVGASTLAVGFSLASTLNTTASTGMATGDFNGDGKPDLAILNADNTISIFLGNGDGTFTAKASAGTLSGGSGFLVADFNGDGKLDLATGNAAGTAVVVLPGNGDGTFGSGVMTSIAGPPAAVGDFNGDGKPDVLVETAGGPSPGVVAGGTIANVTVLLGNGDGTFTASVASATGVIESAAIAVADFNGDGKLDLAVGGPSLATNDSDYDSGTVTVLLGNGDGTFKAPVTIASPSGFTRSIVAVDLNGDGNPDLVVSNEENPAIMANYSGGYLTLLGNGDGTFTNAPGSYQGFPGSATSIAIADFNGDGKSDLALASDFYDAITIQLGNGDGTFTTTPASTVSSKGQTLVTADINGDGLPDLAAGSSQPDSAFILLDSVTETATAMAENVAPVGTGTHLVEASYPGDTSYGASTSSTVALLAGTPAISVSPVTLPMGMVRSAYSQTLTATGGTGPYRYSVTAGTLPQGLSLGASGVLAGTPALSGTYLFTITATDSSTTPNTTSVAYALVIQAAPPAVITISPASIPNGMAGVAYSQTLSANGGTPPYTFSADPSTFPPGITMSSSGVISGTPATGGNYSINVIAEDSSADGPFFGYAAFSLTVTAATPATFMVAGTPAMTTVSAGQPATYAVKITPTGGFTAPITFACSGLPAESACAFAPASVTPAGGAVTTTMTITTTAGTVAANVRPGALGSFGRGLCGVCLAGLALLYVPRRFRGKGRWVMVVLAGILSAGLLPGCGGSQPASSGTTGGTPAGTSIVTITASSGTSSAQIMQTATVTLVVQ
jgi:FG-GAP-like repeat/Putative Ig domain/Bacterial Ig-like domain (group 3)